MKVDYIGEVDCLGVSEISNVIIIVGKDGKSAGFARTFAAQEAPLVPVDWLPNRMDDPFEMGRYVDWLTASITELSNQGNMRKCLKRCASLSRVLFVPEISDAIMNLLTKSTIMLSYKIKGLSELTSVLETQSDPRSRRFLSLVNKQQNDLATKLSALGEAPDELAEKRFISEAECIVTKLLTHVRPGDDPSSRRAA
jgi:hypothetical protein